MANVVKIDLDQIWNPIGVEIPRAYVFAGFGINAANDPKQVDYHLPGLMKLSFAPQSVGDDLLGEYKREFANWILGNALREVIESLEMCLENVFQSVRSLRKVRVSRPRGRWQEISIARARPDD